MIRRPLLLLTLTLAHATSSSHLDERFAAIVPFVNGRGQRASTATWDDFPSTGAFDKRWLTAEAVPPFDIRNPLTRRDVVVLNNYNGTAYWGQIKVGTPPQTIAVEFDTGSSDIYIPSVDCQGKCTGPFFNSSASSSFFDTQRLFSTQAIGDVGGNGTVGTDVISIKSLSVTNQSFGLMRYELNMTASIGLAFPPVTKLGAVPFFFNLVYQKKLASNVFSVYLSRTSDPGITSEVCLGCVDSHKYRGAIKYYPLTPDSRDHVQLHWAIESAGFTLNNVVSTDSILVVLSTGSPYIELPTPLAQQFYANLPQAQQVSVDGDALRGFYMMPCKSIQKLPGIGVIIGNQTYNISNADITLPSDPSLSLPQGYCASSIVDAGVNNTAAILGSPFMRNYYTVFDLGGLRVGLAPLA